MLFKMSSTMFLTPTIHVDISFELKKDVTITLLVIHLCKLDGLYATLFNNIKQIQHRNF